MEFRGTFGSWELSLGEELMLTAESATLSFLYTTLTSQRIADRALPFVLSP
ncbi:hypothetical protein AB0756_36025 [Tolypothrix campylonemoides VB511288_2]|uniref:Uncharacterized protein n=1 Tax=Tolypothrix campylonemoides VB511288_2 TaxID=3232311 RepID=A0ABW8XMP3_9CYAN